MLIIKGWTKIKKLLLTEWKENKPMKAKNWIYGNMVGIRITYLRQEGEPPSPRAGYWSSAAGLHNRAYEITAI